MKMSGRLFSILSIAVVALIIASGSAFAGNTYYVATNGVDVGNPDGTNWNTAFLTISNAVAHATDTDTIIVSNGTYAITAQIVLTNAITLMSTNGQTVTTIDAQNLTDVRCLFVSNAAAVVQGFTLRRGKNSRSGAGVYLWNGTVKWCTFRECLGNVGNIEIDGGTIMMRGGLVTHCIIRDNLYGMYNGTVHIATGSGASTTIRNCLIVNNNYRRAAGIQVNAGRVENCTVVANAAGDAGLKGGILNNGGTVVNSIVYYNTDPGTSSFNYGGLTAISYSCVDVFPVGAGAGNTTNNPMILDVANKNYHLLPGSSCTNAGTTNLTWLADANAVDLDGNPRVVDGKVDIGCYQYRVGALDCAFLGTPVVGISPLPVVFTAYAAGTNTTGLTYAWDFDNNGTTDATGLIVTNTYVTPATYSVSLLVGNAIGEADSYFRTNYVTVAPAVCYVSTNSIPEFPYDSWEHAASSVQPAVDAGVDGTVIWVSNGTYISTAQITISKGVKIYSVNGKGETTLKVNGSPRTVYLNHPDAVVDGFTIGRQGTSGGGVYIYHYGKVANCDLVNASRVNEPGANLYMMGGVASNCTIVGGLERSNGGLQMAGEGAVAVNCVITNNANNVYATETCVGGVTVAAGCTLRNCLVANNTTIGWSGGIYNQGTVENCTVVSNTTSSSDPSACGGVRSKAGLIRNTIVYDNKNTGGGANTNWTWTAGTFEYSCTTPSVAAYGANNIASDPMFKKSGATPFSLAGDSPCINTGSNATWMAGATDLAGSPRLIKQVEMGAYEWLPPPGTLIQLR